MRSRVSAAVLTGALALAALAVPGAQADTHPGAPRPASASAQLPKAWDVVVNGGKPVVLGTTAPKKVTVTFKASHPDGVFDAAAELWHGRSWDEQDVSIPSDGSSASCTSGATATCRATFSVDPARYMDHNGIAGDRWKAGLSVVANGGKILNRPEAKGFAIQRASRLTVNAAPEPVRAGAAITVTGALTRADWEAYKYSGYSGQPVKLQFRKAGTDSYTTLTSVRSDRAGKLTTTVKAVTDGYFRYSFVGTTSTTGVNATGDFVDVR
ncbi:hypothetical protein [Streptomyces yaizuensis]|uniref:Calcium-binding protein n=1 Tax=Streptomyces yaizuensis TaxID=2989713 RepID=A0ABQ5PAX9_9ACTN|nr:hypothetical protein [Streptomyces sp. YSPA8]GLF99744.1 calcium-binding protein [Streptomyces sp. YSPA8]